MRTGASPERIDERSLRRWIREGPRPEDDARLLELAAQMIRRIAGASAEALSDAQRSQLHAILGDRLTDTTTLFGHAYCKPHGYAGDFEIIDKIYTRHLAADPVAARWDRCFQALAGPRAVRNRKEYFKARAVERLAGSSGPLRVLNLASGPGRDLQELFDEHPEAAERMRFDCVEQDPAAIAHARRLLGAHAARVRFHADNVLRHRPEGAYDWIWSAGLFDYFEDRIFVRLLARLVSCLSPGGELTIGNFHPRDPSRPLMILQDWTLHYRTEDDLRELARRATEGWGGRDASRGIERTTVEQEAEGVNLFLRMSSAPSRGAPAGGGGGRDRPRSRMRTRPQ